MAKPTTAGQRRIIAGADPVTGRLRGTEAQLAALVRLRLAFRHPRPPHAYFLTPAGHRVREEPVEAVPETAPVEVPSGVFTPRTGTEQEPPGEDGPARAREVRSAWLGIVEMRRMTNPGGDRTIPCAWERTHRVRAVAIALEAAGRVPAGPGREGYRVVDTAQPDAVEVGEASAEGTRACGAVLERAGWLVSEHGDARTGRRYVLVSPRRA
ncbi:hypothetical protein [Streptomyces spectabilis]|uniref:Uncharacterized protein n=1 Tax=Streptomyces spectabilis TaxID=68270 RepID=A0A516RFP5_STRST|nr:hypothetical protein [Streptomyces spectabilis]QDQ14461.1 hypothetical protein FH965_31125 [Streptomyces spectabilis]